MTFPPLKEGIFVERVNRFVCSVNLGGSIKMALLRNTGRLRELLVPGAKVYLKERRSGKYDCEVVLVKSEKSLVCVDSHMAPMILEEYIRERGIPWRAESIKREPKVGRSRFDLLLDGKVLVETKSVNLVRDRIALFPDAPTERGKKHVEDLIELSSSFLPAVVFIVQREDAEIFSPNYETDHEFGRILERFHSIGFPVKAYLCRVSLYEIRIWKEIPVVFNMSFRR